MVHNTGVHVRTSVTEENVEMWRLKSTFGAEHMTASCGDEPVNLYLNHKDIIYLSAHKHSEVLRMRTLKRLLR